MVSLLSARNLKSAAVFVFPWKTGLLSPALGTGSHPVQFSTRRSLRATSNSLHEMTRSGPLVRLFIPKELSSSPHQPPYPGIMAGITLPLGATAPKKHESRLTNENCRYHCPHILHFSRLAISAPGEVWPRSSEGPAGPASGRGHHSILPCQGVFEADGGIQEARGEATCWQQALIGFVAGPFRSPESIVTVTL